MGLRNLFGEIALEETQVTNRLTQEEMLAQILIELRKLNLHMTHISDQRITNEDIGSEEYN